METTFQHHTGKASLLQHSEHHSAFRKPKSSHTLTQTESLSDKFLNGHRSSQVDRMDSEHSSSSGRHGTNPERSDTSERVKGNKSHSQSPESPRRRDAPPQHVQPKLSFSVDSIISKPSVSPRRHYSHVETHSGPASPGAAHSGLESGCSEDYSDTECDNVDIENLDSDVESDPGQGHLEESGDSGPHRDRDSGSDRLSPAHSPDTDPVRKPRPDYPDLQVPRSSGFSVDGILHSRARDSEGRPLPGPPVMPPLFGSGPPDLVRWPPHAHFPSMPSFPSHPFMHRKYYFIDLQRSWEIIFGSVCLCVLL